MYKSILQSSTGIKTEKVKSESESNSSLTKLQPIMRKGE